MFSFIQIPLVSIGLLVAAAGYAAGQSPGHGCGTRTLDGGYPFGDAWDEYSRATAPRDSEVRGHWRLVGATFRSTRESGLPNRFSRDGLDIDGSIPTLRFLDRAEISDSGFLMGNSSRAFALVVRWGTVDLRTAYPVSLHYLPRQGDEPKSGCMTFESKLYGSGGDVFPTHDRRPHGRAQLYCREDVQGLICMVEKLGRLGDVELIDYGPVVSDGVVGFLRFQRN